MTKKITASYTALLCMAVVLAGTATAQASEVTGTLTSSTDDTTSVNGSISGTVTSNNGGSSSGGSRNNRSRVSSNAPTSQVLGASTSNTSAPSFPNAGFAPEEESVNQTLWSTLTTFFKNTFSF